MKFRTVFNSTLSALLSLILVLAMFGCSSAEKIDSSTAEGAFAMGQKFEKDERYEEAISAYSDVKNKFPYSRFAVEAALKIADIEFARENYVEAESAYRLFKEFHPNHPKIDYVTYQTGLSVYNQLPPTTDRDLTLATAAIDYFDQVINSYPSSEFVTKAKEYKEKAQKMLAEKADYIAQFYFKRMKWEAALGRFEDMMKNFPIENYAVKSLYGATVCAYRMKDMDKAKTYFKKLLAEYPNSPELDKARKELADGF